MFTCVIGFPAAGYIGSASMSIVDFDAAAEVLSALGAATLAALGAFEPSLFADAGSAASFAVDLWGMLRMSLYLDCLRQSAGKCGEEVGRRERRTLEGRRWCRLCAP